MKSRYKTGIWKSVENNYDILILAEEVDQGV